MDLSKSQIFQKRKIINSDKKFKMNNSFIIKKDTFNLKNNIYKIENNEISSMIKTKTKKQKAKLNNSLQLEPIYRPQNKYDIKNISKSKIIQNSERNLCSKTASNSLEKLKELDNINEEEENKLKNKKFNVKQKDKNKHKNLILIKDNKLEQIKIRSDDNANKNIVKPISERAKTKKII